MSTLAAWVVLGFGLVVGICVGVRLGQEIRRLNDRAEAYRDGYAAGRAEERRLAADVLDARLDAAERLRRHEVVAECEFFDIEAMQAARSDHPAGGERRWHGG